MESKGELGLKKKHKLSELNERYGLKRKGLKNVIGELKQRMLAKSVWQEDMSKELNNSGKIESLILIRRRYTQNSKEVR